MNISKHTPEPWRAQAWSSHAARTVLVDDPAALTGKRVIAECDTEEDARRIVACVNACAGLTTDLLECKTIGEASETMVDRLVDQRDELAAALRKARVALSLAGHHEGISGTLIAVDAALAKVFA